ncbi:MAG: GspH/FimT family protein [Armatimonadota bacterium]|nr:GspH/FimT family protein [Armatimonadota bacterium]
MHCFFLATALSHGDFRFRLRQAGYSLYDLMVSSTIASVLGVGAVSMSGLVQDTRMTAAVNQLMGHLSLARSEAIKRNTRITLCKSRDGASCTGDSAWQEGWQIFVDDNKNHELDAGETILYVQEALSGNMTLHYGNTGTFAYIGYNSAGEAIQAATFTFCDGRGAEKAKGIIVFWTGRPRVSTKTSDGEPLNCS